MNKLKRGKINRSKKSLFNPYANGISSYDLAYLSSKRGFKNKRTNLQNVSKEEDYAA